MYSQEAINVLIDRIGWSESLSDLPFQLSEVNKKADSGNTFDWYHSLVNLDTIYATIPLKDITAEKFNTYLQNLRKSCVLSVLKSILDRHVDYIPDFDYSSILIDRPELFDDAIGYLVAIKVIESYISSPRENASERNAKIAYQQLKIELEGAKNDQGHIVARGIKDNQKQAVLNAQKVIFPIIPTTFGTDVW